jgi:energy-coupling factor transporter ATP-binding protein EcfA2
MAEDPVTAAPPSEEPALLELEDMAAAPPGAREPVLRDVGLRLRRGEVGVLLGGNGAGKSTLLRTAAGLWPPRSGRVRNPAGGGFDPRRVALLLEDPASQFVGGTVAGELEFALENLGLDGTAIRDRRDAALAEFGLTPLADRDPLRLSAGEQQLCLLASAWVLDPPLILLDDPFLYLGPGSGLVHWRKITARVRAGRIGAVLLATHDAEAALEADRVGILAGGRLRSWEAPARAFETPLPAAVAAPLGIWLEGKLRSLGWRLEGVGWTADAMAERVAAEVAP